MTNEELEKQWREEFEENNYPAYKDESLDMLRATYSYKERLIDYIGACRKRQEEKRLNAESSKQVIDRYITTNESLKQEVGRLNNTVQMKALMLKNEEIIELKKEIEELSGYRTRIRLTGDDTLIKENKKLRGLLERAKPWISFQLRLDTFTPQDEYSRKYLEDKRQWLKEAEELLKQGKGCELQFGI